MSQAKATLEREALMKESAGMQGALGAVAYTVLKGLQAGGADPKLVSSVRLLMQEHFQKLSDEDCNVLCDVLFGRLQEEAKKGRWYV